MLGLFVFRMPFDEVAGIISGACGNPAILAYANRLAPTEATGHRLRHDLPGDDDREDPARLDRAGVHFMNAVHLMNAALHASPSGACSGRQPTSVPRCIAQGAALALQQHLEVASRLRRLDDAEGVLLPGHGHIDRVVAGDLQEDAGVRSALVGLPGRVQEARAELQAGRDALRVADLLDGSPAARARARSFISM